MDFYKLLNVSRTATVLEIKTAYRKLALSLHPDVTKNDKRKSDQFRLISSAYKILVDEKERSKYDQTIGNRRVTYRPPETKQTHQPRTRPPIPTVEIGFNYAVWNAWHYGDNAIVEPSVRQRGSWMNKNMEDNAHYRYYSKKKNREDAEKMSHKVVKEEDIRKTAVDNLRHKREERRSKERKGGSSDCTIC